MTPSRRDDLKQMLERRRQEIRAGVQNKMRMVRDNRAANADRAAVDDLELRSEDDLDLALIQMNAENISRITDALARLERGEYGRCAECDEDIPENRLRALPFATRCRSCQDDFEAETRRQRQAGSTASTTLLGYMSGGAER